MEAYGERSVAGASQDEVQDGISGEEAAKSTFKEKEDEKLASAEQINLDINAKTEELIREFKEELSKTEYKNLDVSYSVILNSEDYYVLALSVLKQEGDTQTIHHYYTVDKHSGELLQLAKLFPDRPDYKEILSEEVVRQIKAHNQNSKDKYFLQKKKDFPPPKKGGASPRFAFSLLFESARKREVHSLFPIESGYPRAPGSPVKQDPLSFSEILLHSSFIPLFTFPTIGFLLALIPQSINSLSS